MPGNIPTYQPDATPAPVPTAYDRTQVTPASQGAAVGEGLESAASKLNEKGQQLRDQAVAGAVMQNVADVETSISGKLANFKQLKGTNAAEQSAAVVSDIQKTQQTAITGIQDPDVARLTKLRTIGSVASAQAEINQHVAEQNQVGFAQSYQAVQATALDGVGRNAATPDLRQRYIDNMTAPLVLEARRQGLEGTVDDPSTPAGNWARTQFYGPAAQVALSSLLNANNVNGAAAYFAQPGVRAAMGPVAAEEFEGRLRAHQDLQGSMIDGFALLKQNQISGTSLYDEASARAQAMKTLSGKVSPERLSKTLDFIHEQSQLGLDAQQKSNAQQFNNALTTALTMAQNGQPVLLPPDSLAYLSNPKNQAGAQRLALDEAVRRVQENGYNAVPTSQQATNYGRMLLAMVDPGQGYGAKSIDEMHVNAMQLPGGVTPRQLGELDTHLAAAHAQADQNLEGQLVTHVRDEMIRAKVPGTNKSFEKWDDNSSAALPYVVDQVEKAVQAAGGKKATNLQEVIAKATRDAIVNVNVNGTGLVFRDTTARAIAETAPQYAGHALEPVIPRSERKAISAALVGAGIKTPTDAQVMTAYKKRHGFQ